jgi:hypothetical protein
MAEARGIVAALLCDPFDPCNRRAARTWLRQLEATCACGEEGNALHVLLGCQGANDNGGAR